MPKLIQAQDVTLTDLIEKFSLEKSVDDNFFSEYSEYVDNLAEITDLEKQYLDRVKTNYISLVENSPLLEEAVKLVVLSPLLDLAGFYRYPFQIATEEPIEISEEVIVEENQEGNVNQTEIIKGKIDILVLHKRLWLLVIESQRTNFSLQKAIPQALTYMLASPNLQQLEKNIYGFVTNGEDFQFIKLGKIENKLVYDLSDRFTLYKRENELYQVLSILKKLGQIAIN
jgi:hypothetical protein